MWDNRYKEFLATLQNIQNLSQEPEFATAAAFSFSDYPEFQT